MQQPVEQRGDGGGVAEQLPPVVDWSIRGEHRGGPLVTAHDQLEQVLGRGVGQLAHAEATATQQLPDWVDAHTRMVEYFGGTTVYRTRFLGHNFALRGMV